MKATELLEKQHREVESLFKAFERAKGNAAKAAVFERIAKTLVAHDAIERELFYPACEKHLGDDDDTLQESLVEHGLAEFSIFRADANRKSDDLEAYVTVLQEVIEHHVKEEQDELFPKIKKKIDDDEHEELGAAMEKRFKEALATDFRRPLRANLKQVLAGRMKTSKRGKKTASRRPARGKAGAKRARRA